MAPLRTCIGCGTTRPQSELFRVGLSGERVQLDVARRLPGRGGYVCGSPFVEAALKRKGFGRAFRQKAQVDARALQNSLLKADVAKKARGVR